VTVCGGHDLEIHNSEGFVMGPLLGDDGGPRSVNKVL